MELENELLKESKKFQEEAYKKYEIKQIYKCYCCNVTLSYKSKRSHFNSTKHCANLLVYIKNMNTN